MSRAIVLTIEDAAEVLNVSSAFVGGLLESGALSSHVVDGRRWVKEEDLKQVDDRECEAVLDELAAEAQHHGLGY